MCGIAGFISNKSEFSQDILAEMTHSLSHRGPDGFGLKIFETDNKQIGLGHRRLSIIELTELGAQPMIWNQFSIVFNGEIYNYKELKTDLEKLGHAFSSDSDTEVLLHAYSEWGEKCLSRLIGMFAFFIYNKETEEFFIARDRTGIKPLFYYLESQTFLFASELKAFHKHPSFKKELSVKAVHAFLQYGSVPTPHCIFENCYKINPGHYIKSSVSKWDFRETAYWNVYDHYNKPKLDISIEDAKRKTEDILLSACNYRMVSDVPVGVFLSGGYDSACVTALLQKELSTPLKTFTISVPDIGLNEATFARETATLLGTNHTEIECTQAEALQIIPTLPFYYDEPFADSSAIPTTLVAKAAKNHVTVALSADGGDEVFAGYNRYEMILKYNQKINKIPAFLRKATTSLMDIVPANNIPVLKHKYNFAQRYEKVKSVLKNYSDQNVMLSLSQLFNDQQLQKICKTTIEPFTTKYNSKELMNYSMLSYLQAIDYQTYLVDDILQKVDRASMSVALESREPLLDHRIIEFVAQLPDNYKYRNGEKKWLLKEITHQYLPKEKMDRPKMGFAIPIEDWLKKDLREIVEHYLSEKIIDETNLFNTQEIIKLKNDFLNGKKEYGTKIWYLLSFMMWYDYWINNQKNLN